MKTKNKPSVKTLATSTKVTAQTKSQELIEKSEVEQMMEDDAGQGVSTKSSDNLVPTIIYLQPLSPQVLDDNPARIAGAKAGDFILNDTKTVISGKKGIWFQPCHADQLLLRFVPQNSGGGFVGAYPYNEDRDGNFKLPQGANREPKNPNRVKFDNGDELVHYRIMAGIAWLNGVPLEYVIKFKSTGHTVFKNWNTTAGRVNRFANGKSRSLFNHVYHLTTASQRNKHGQWFIVSVESPVLLLPMKKVKNLIEENNHLMPEEMQTAMPDLFAEDIVGGDVEKAYLLGRQLANAFKSKERVASLEDEEQSQEAEGTF